MSPHNALLAVADSQGVSILAMAEAMTHLFDLGVQLGRSSVIRSVQFSPDGNKLVALVESSQNAFVHVWDIEQIMMDLDQRRLNAIDWDCGEIAELYEAEKILVDHNVPITY